MKFPTATEAANRGLAFALSQPRATNTAAVIGYTSVDETTERLRQLSVDVAKLDAAFTAYLPAAEPLRAGWMGWRNAFRNWFERYAGEHASSVDRASIYLHSDAFAQEADKQAAQYVSFRDAYNAWAATHASPQGKPIPVIEPPAAEQAKGHGAEGRTGGLPWWFWVGTGAVVVGAGYLVYLKIQEGRAKAKILKEGGHHLLNRYLGPAGEEAYRYSQAGRDLSPPTRDPMRLATYAYGSNEPNRGYSPGSRGVSGAEPLTVYEAGSWEGEGDDDD